METAPSDFSIHETYPHPMAGPNAVLVQDALQHPGRCAVLQACMGPASSAKDIATRTGLPSVTCYRHLKHLTDTGLLVIDRSAITPDGHPYDLYRSTLTWARLAVTEQGIQPEWKLRSGMGDRLYRLWSQLEDRQ